MKIEVAREEIQNVEADAIIVNLFEGVTQPSGATGAVDQALGGLISDLIAGGDFSGKANLPGQVGGEVAVLYPRQGVKARRVIVVGLGGRDGFSLEAVRRASATAVKKARELGAKRVATIIHGAGIGDLQPQEAALATMEGALLGLYRVNVQKSDAEPQPEIQTLVIVERDAGKIPAIEAARSVAMAEAEGVTLTRNLVNLPPSQCTPSRMAQEAEQIAQQHSMQLTVGDRAWAAERKMGGFLGVAQGALEEPKFIVLEHHPEGSQGAPIVLVGKGITFDSGGISIKPSEKMEDMKSDMAGAAAVLGTMKTIGMLNLPQHVVAIMPCTENMPDAGAYHPADIITFSNGKTAEVISTDAEGRMVLADALVYAQQYKPAAVIDLATLTGACVVALGEGVAAGLFCNQDALCNRLLASSERTYDRLWRLPLWDDYKKKIASLMADMKNTGGRAGGVGTSAIFLKEFTDYPWAHLDIAGMAMYSSALSPYIGAGGSGFGVRLLVDFVRNWN